METRISTLFFIEIKDVINDKRLVCEEKIKKIREIVEGD